MVHVSQWNHFGRGKCIGKRHTLENKLTVKIDITSKITLPKNEFVLWHILSKGVNVILENN